MHNKNVTSQHEYCDDSLLVVEYCQIGSLCFKKKFQELIKTALIDADYPAAAKIWIMKSNPIESASDIYALASRFVTIQNKFTEDGELYPGRDYWSLLKDLEMDGVNCLILD